MDANDGNGMRVVLVRHTRVEAAGLCYGRSEVGLAASFEDEVVALKAGLPWVPLEVWTSPSRRCVALAERIAGGAGVRTDARLQELNFGAWEGRRWESFHGVESEAWALDPWGRSPPGGETGRAMWARVAAVWAEAAALPLGARVAVVTHAGVIRMWRGLAAGMEPGAGVLAEEVGYGRVWPGV